MEHEAIAEVDCGRSSSHYICQKRQVIRFGYGRTKTAGSLRPSESAYRQVN